jgi:hypothetical protein
MPLVSAKYGPGTQLLNEVLRPHPGMTDARSPSFRRGGSTMKAIRNSRRIVLVAISAAASIGFAIAAAQAASDPVAKCQSAKNKAAGKYSSCLGNAESKVVTTGDTAAYGAALAKCVEKFSNAWQKAIDSATKAGATCLDAPLTALDFQSIVDQHAANIATALDGGVLIDYAAALACGDGLVAGAEQCDQGNLNGQTCVTQGFGAGALACGDACLFDTSGCFTNRFVDNLDGTVTDNRAGLTWEKKADLDGVGVVCASAAVCPDPHDADNLYTYSFDNPLGPPGTAYTVFLAQLNAGGGFAGHTDWRLPTYEELQGIVDYADPSSPVTDASFDSACSGACTVTTCSCTSPDRHWSSSGSPIDAGTAWFVDFSWGDVGHDMKDTGYAARGVRGP